MSDFDYITIKDENDSKFIKKNEQIEKKNIRIKNLSQKWILKLNTKNITHEEKALICLNIAYYYSGLLGFNNIIKLQELDQLFQTNISADVNILNKGTDALIYDNKKNLELKRTIYKINGRANVIFNVLKKKKDESMDFWINRSIESWKKKANGGILITVHDNTNKIMKEYHIDISFFCYVLKLKMKNLEPTKNNFSWNWGSKYCKICSNSHRLEHFQNMSNNFIKDHNFKKNLCEFELSKIIPQSCKKK